jgi:hypothetical protein
MDDLLQAMQIVDRVSTSLPEGDYIEICKHLKNAYNKRADPVYFFDYENFSVPEFVSSPEIFRYFYDYYFDKALCLDSEFIHGQISYLEKELLNSQPIKRITKKVMSDVKRHYRFIFGIDDETSDMEFSDSEWRQLYKTYVQTENNFRKKYCDSIAMKLAWLEESDYRLDSM